ncbi:hypothetical protein T07_4383 [Trichinella nelsoni]|uniref:Uncharacterized protein n=1 Tax=Trichinella nelsoni TaxID=6336 RepID=A0A0V0RXC1_9BILA|nr:hypothetical protein T07_4383 [Trichinella nelsoni]
MNTAYSVGPWENVSTCYTICHPFLESESIALSPVASDASRRIGQLVDDDRKLRPVIKCQFNSQRKGSHSCMEKLLVQSFKSLQTFFKAHDQAL